MIRIGEISLVLPPDLTHRSKRIARLLADNLAAQEISKFGYIASLTPAPCRINLRQTDHAIALVLADAITQSLDEREAGK